MCSCSRIRAASVSASSPGWNGTDRLNDNRTRVHFMTDVMHRATAEPDPGVDHPRMYIQSLEGRQQGRMDINQPITPRFAEFFAEQSHEPGKNDKLTSGGLDFLANAPIKAFPVGEVLVPDRNRSDPGSFGRGPAPVHPLCLKSQRRLLPGIDHPHWHRGSPACSTPGRKQERRSSSAP